MGVIASGPPFVNRELCECGWMWQDECKKLEKCGLNQGMPGYKDIPSPKESSGNCGVDDTSPKWVLVKSVDSWPDTATYDANSVHTPYEFLSESAKEAAVNVVRDMIEDSKSTQVGGTHYSEMKVQPWEAMRAWMSPAEYTAYHVGTVIGYLSRHKKKGGLTDIKKAKHHLEELVRYFEEEEEYPW